MTAEPAPSPPQAASLEPPSSALSSGPLDDSLFSKRILFIGGGNMAGAMISGLVASGLPAGQIGAIEPVAAAARALHEKHGVTVSAGADDIGDTSHFDAIVLAVKPQQASVALKASRGLLGRLPDAVLISIAAGLDVALLRAMSGGHRRVVRAMPNTPALIGAGISGLFAPADAAPGDLEIARAVLASTGEVVTVDQEHLLDIVTAVSGSGPAYAFILMEAMIEAGVSGGLDAGSARALALNTVKGAALLAIASDEPPQVLRTRVTSPAGTTAAAVAVLERREVKAGIGEAIRAAASRSRELSEEAKVAQDRLA